MALLASLAPLIRALLAQRPLRMPRGRLGIMQSGPERAHLLYAEPDLLSSDACGISACCSFSTKYHLSYPPVFSSQGRACRISSTDHIGFWELVHGALRKPAFSLTRTDRSSYIARFSTRLTIAHRPVNAARTRCKAHTFLFRGISEDPR
ncbi:hypothetical protein F5888DRAFT_1710026 [Russula emetica]|nr:hypothetical protein F5888DRAFT_1710026 [Russula emetica]